MCRTERPQLEFHRVSLQDNRPGPNVRTFTVDRIREAAAIARRRASACLQTVLLLDEYTFLDPVHYPVFADYDQVVATGDPAQGCCPGHNHPETFLDHMRAAGAEAVFTDRVWRSTNLAASCLLDYYVYGKQTVATPGYSTKLADIHRSNSVKGGSAGVALAIYARMLQARRLNPTFEYGIAIRDRDAIDMLADLTAHLRYAEGVETRHVYVDPAYIQGLQTDVLLVNCRDMDAIYRTPRSIARALCTLFGRPRTRVELLFDHDADRSPEGRLTFSLLAKSILAIVPEQRSELPEFADAAANLEAAGISTIPVDNGVMLYARRTGRPLQIVHSTAGLADRGLEMLHLSAGARRLKWRDPALTIPSLASRLVENGWGVKNAPRS